jgi:ABC-type Zn2+ transport system substrate-binding protein/surface adhesin
LNKEERLSFFLKEQDLFYGTEAKIKRGVFKILEFIKTKSYVVNHNAGKYWNNSFLIRPGKIED